MCNPIFGRFLRFFLLNDAPKMYLIQPLTPLLFFHLLHRYIAHIKSYFFTIRYYAQYRNPCYILFFEEYINSFMFISNVTPHNNFKCNKYCAI